MRSRQAAIAFVVLAISTVLTPESARAGAGECCVCACGGDNCAADSTISSAQCAAGSGAGEIPNVCFTITSNCAARCMSAGCDTGKVITGPCSEMECDVIDPPLFLATTPAPVLAPAGVILAAFAGLAGGLSRLRRRR